MTMKSKYNSLLQASRHNYQRAPLRYEPKRQRPFLYLSNKKIAYSSGWFVVPVNERIFCIILFTFV